MNNELTELPENIESVQKRNNEIPTNGIGDASAMIESLLSNSHIPEHLKKGLWIFFSRTAKLTFLDESDVKMLMLQAELIRLSILESMPKQDYDEELEMELQQIIMEFFMTLKRSVGGAGGMSERILLGSSTQMNFSDKQIGGNSQNKGFIDKITGLFR